MTDKTNKTDPTGWHHAMKRAHSEGAYLGDREAVENIVKGFVGYIFRRIDRVSDGGITQEMAINADKGACYKMSLAFMGEDSDFTSMGDWNEGGGLARFLRRELGHLVDVSGDDRHIIEQFFALVVMAVYHIISQLHEEGESALEVLPELIENSTNMLLGMPGKIPL